MHILIEEKRNGRLILENVIEVMSQKSFTNSDCQRKGRVLRRARKIGRESIIVINKAMERAGSEAEKGG